MKSQSQHKRVCFETIQELEVYQMNQIAKRIKKVKIQITKNSDNLITFSQGNTILKKAYPCELQNNIDIFQNIEQIQNLEWQGEYGSNKRKLGMWIATWKGKQILGVGGYYKDEQKIGLWKQPIKNYWSQAQVYESGEYFEDQKCGRWNYIYKNKIIYQIQLIQQRRRII
ncbi:unnamed protein product (macronuclear) [Paramecium tetraurelia]|uniref:C-type lectin domain-containing protein n=1 Tax=Paramecium tetraurelia TaxID=5888 RepID=A0CTY0_PARTE|nr:uncharacterized protein GSPATT00038980001 [Paramecium tetraurelia]CAK74247.1 unnamed protein product [Paramecium tetraurelia]|eukprot:XP_001441644.1 hypothetical protein (macronuclear) [Paramecium tetraurelia strain d4-2]